MIVDILIIDTEEQKMEELTGKPSDTPEMFVPLNFRDSSFDSFWVDDNDNTIVFYVNGISYRTPYRESTLGLFRGLVRE